MLLQVPPNAVGSPPELATCRILSSSTRRKFMAQKVIDIVGVSPQSLAKAAENAIAEAGKTIRGMRWARVSELEMVLEKNKIVEYRANARIYFDVER